jgi:hypothetical protein
MSGIILRIELRKDLNVPMINNSPFDIFAVCNDGDSPQANGSCGLAAATYKIRFGILHVAA